MDTESKSPLQLAREARLLSRSDLAKAAGVSAALIFRLEKGEGGTPRLSTQRRLLDALGIPYSHAASMFAARR